MTRWTGRDARTGRFIKAKSVKQRQYRREVRAGKRAPKGAKNYTVIQAVSRAIIPGTRPAPGKDYIGRRYVEALETKVYPGKLSKKEKEKKRKEAKDRLTKEIVRQLGQGNKTNKVAYHVISGIDVTTRTAKRRPKETGTVIDVRDDKQNKRAKYKGRMERT